ncbi:monovalent cation/H+ antiporter subunit A [Caldichromatium japonicum]|uniref:Monovalent cation/H+ antiporter subunit A n=1 Tax=Caldichromatium japonicum TaxID=2699430 RepID=A0A6G7VET6_9GAMM|nr:monovalent cation/H+ antiporter subunit A [Caldichromatium japonicum]QIK38307.1 monovalent cation/H+ antiporter subunit A [Caldichromatium japonicum]
MSLLFTILLPLFGAPTAFWASRFGRIKSAWTAGIITSGAVLCLVTEIPSVAAGQTLLWHLEWVPMLGVDLDLRLDGLGLLFALLILAIGLLVILYARYYLPERDDLGRFYAYLLFFMGAMLGIVLSENLILMLVFWELTSLSSFLLISYSYRKRESRQGARMALAITGMGGLALLGGILLLGEVAGSHQLSAVLVRGEAVRADPLYIPLLILILLGVFTKSAQCPFHFWLPRAMVAPTPVSAYLHSATMVKAGIFLLARLFPVLSGTTAWTWLVMGAGLVTLLFGAWIALFKHDLKGLLAYSTISHLGLITLLLGMGTPLAAVAAVFHVFNHATFKASLFMAAGIIDHECGTRDMRRINGLWRFMPYTGTLAMVAAASMAGVPLFNGFLSKEMFFAETANFATGLDHGWLLPLLVVIAGALAVAYSLRFIHDVFFNGTPVDLPRMPHEPPFWMKVPAAVLVGACLLVGIVPEVTVDPILRLAAGSVLQGPLPEFDLGIWHGFELPVVMSLTALLAGVFLYALRRRLFRLAARLERRIDAGILYERSLAELRLFAAWITRRLDGSSLQQRLLFLLLAALALGTWGFVGASAPLLGSRILMPIDGMSLMITAGFILVILTTLGLQKQRFTALIVVGALGLLVSLVFVKFSAPDLALTQLVVEIVTIVLLLLALYFLPQQSPDEPGRVRVGRDALVACAFGLGTGLLSMSILTRPFTPISGYFLDNSLPKGGGANVVNVILVDFRGFDTLGEITVLALAALAIHALLKGLRLPGLTRDNEGRPWNWDLHPVIMAVLSRLLLPLALLVAVFILLRGHNAPGGGFIAGLISAVALILQYLSNGVTWTHQRLSGNMLPPIGAGLLLASLTGLASLWFGHPFLTSAFIHVHWPIVGDFELVSAMLFDLGVYLVVVGATLLILIQLGGMHRATHPGKRG